MKWQSCEHMPYDELTRIVSIHLRKHRLNRVILKYHATGRGNAEIIIHPGDKVLPEGLYHSYLLTHRHPNAELIQYYVDAVRPIYMEGNKVGFEHLDFMKGVKLSLEPPIEDKAIAEYRRYLSRFDGDSTRMEIVNKCNEEFVPRIEAHHAFICWIDKDWRVEEVEL